MRYETEELGGGERGFLIYVGRAALDLRQFS
jgi:hypothetical protein